MKLVDLSWPIYPGMARIPVTPEIEMRQVSQIAAGDSCNITEIRLASHVGTHIDAPYHFIPGGKTIDQLPLAHFTGPAVTVSIKRQAGEAITPQDLDQADIRPDDIVLLHTGWSAKFDSPEYQRHPYLIPETAEWLVRRQVKMLGVDCVNVDMPIADRPAGYNRPIHHTLLGNEVLIIEKLTNLDQISGQRVRLFAFPIPYRECDGAQARVVAELS
ncbi:MAG TPA: cyclase family protein [Chloroflexota bacterium]|nr:cyclase family protein [Chloroflexota bacterium]